MAETTSHDVVCPFCGIGCDDVTLTVDGAAVTAAKGTCGRAAQLFARSGAPAPSARIAGKDVSFEEAVAEAAKRLGASKAIAYAGLGTDVDGVRAVLKLAAKTGGSVDHYASEGMFRNLASSQRKGWVATTFAEVRNRCDLFVVVGPDPSKAYHRVYERVLPATGRFVEGPRRVVFLGGAPTEDARRQLEGLSVEIIATPEGGLVDALSQLSALVAGATPPSASPELAALAESLKAARYGVLAWSAASLDDDGDLVIERAVSVVDTLNATTRAACLPLSGKDNLTGAYHATLWNIGFPLRVGFRDGVSDHDQTAYATANAVKQADLVVWTSAFRPELPPASDAAVIALSHPDTVFATEPHVFIPVGQPGLDHQGLAFRADSVVGLPLRRHRDAGLKSVADVVTLISEARA